MNIIFDKKTLLLLEAHIEENVSFGALNFQMFQVLIKQAGGEIKSIMQTIPASPPCCIHVQSLYGNNCGNDEVIFSADLFKCSNSLAKMKGGVGCWPNIYQASLMFGIGYQTSALALSEGNYHQATGQHQNLEVVQNVCHNDIVRTRVTWSTTNIKCVSLLSYSQNNGLVLPQKMFAFISSACWPPALLKSVTS